MNLKSGLLAISFPLIIYSCTNPVDVGLEVQPTGDLVGILVTDTITLSTKTIREDSIPSAQNTLNLVGSYIDPIFGLTAASFSAQVRIPSSNVNFGTNPVVDSVILSLAYKGYYGDSTNIGSQNILVHRIAEDLYRDTVYYSNKKFTVSDQLADLTLTPAPYDSIEIAGVKKAPHLRLKLENSFAQNVILSQSGQTPLSTDAEWIKYFKGIQVSTNTSVANGQGGIMYFDYTSSLTRLTVYYHNDSDDSLNYEFVINDNSSRVNHYEHNFNGSVAGMSINDSILGLQNVYLQSLSGTKIEIQLPHLLNLKNIPNLSINKAELIIPAQNISGNVYNAPVRLLVNAIDSTGNAEFIQDIFESLTYYNGSLNESTAEYRFNIARHIQRLLNGSKQNYGLYLVASGAAVNGNRVVLNGGGQINGTQRMRLAITYSQFN
ncbi:MAG TPA: DUF4270 domain-containing protein [Bacteroidia bacterium]|nr:DUF4270 domain-containing protein [Bacteroidia bacterium]HNT79844.1 DUF4270 domain-containing protein [Bacteroidia bacterium]